MALTAQNVVINLFYYAVTAVAPPLAALLLEAAVGKTWTPSFGMRAAAALLGIAGVGLQLWCISVMQVHGGGTPSPVRPSTRLVTTGPYGWVRNPLNIGELAVFAALAMWFASWALAAYLLIAAVAFHWFIVAWEEPRHRLLFGERYLAYSHRVNRWKPAIRHPNVACAVRALEQCLAADDNDREARRSRGGIAQPIDKALKLLPKRLVVCRFSRLRVRQRCDAQARGPGTW